MFGFFKKSAEPVAETKDDGQPVPAPALSWRERLKAGLARTRAQLVEHGQAARVEQIERDAQAEIDAALATASAAPPPEPGAAYTDIQTVGAGMWA